MFPWKRRPKPIKTVSMAEGIIGFLKKLAIGALAMFAILAASCVYITYNLTPSVPSSTIVSPPISPQPRQQPSTAAPAQPDDIHVKEYTRKDGTRVRAHTRKRSE